MGKAVSLAFADAGADIVLVSRGEKALLKVKAEIELKNKKAWIFTHDFSDTQAIPELYDRILEQTKSIDIIVNAAGMIFRTDAADFPLEEWNKILAVNLTAPFVLSQCFAKSCMKQQKPGKIINFASLLSRAARPSLPAYTASKGGIVQLTAALAVEWAEHRINVNAIGPGYFETEMTRPLSEDKEFSEWVKQRTPMNRWGQPSELTGTAVFLASEASNFITGQTIYVDGGWLANL